MMNEARLQAVVDEFSKTKQKTNMLIQKLHQNKKKRRTNQIDVQN